MSPLLVLFILLQIQHFLVNTAAQRSISLFAYQKTYDFLQSGAWSSRLSLLPEAEQLVDKKKEIAEFLSKKSTK